MHLCRGNNQSGWVASGGYEPVAEVLFNEADVAGYFLEYDSERAGGFEPLRFVPKGKTVVLGLVTSKKGDAGEQGHDQAADRRGGEVLPARSARAQHAVRIFLDRRRQQADRRAAGGEAAARGGGGARGVGLGSVDRCAAQPCIARLQCAISFAGRGTVGLICAGCGSGEVTAVPPVAVVSRRGCSRRTATSRPVSLERCR